MTRWRSVAGATETTPLPCYHRAMELIINGDLRRLSDTAQTVESLLAELGMAGTPCAVEVNKQVVPKRQHAAHTLVAGDEVEIVTLVGGG